MMVAVCPREGYPYDLTLPVAVTRARTFQFAVGVRRGAVAASALHPMGWCEPPKFCRVRGAHLGGVHDLICACVPEARGKALHAWRSVAYWCEARADLPRSLRAARGYVCDIVSRW